MTNVFLIKSLFVFNLFFQTIFSVLHILNTNLLNPNNFSFVKPFMPICGIHSDLSKRHITPTPINDFFSTKDFLI
jgi:hypothetical protein